MAKRVKPADKPGKKERRQEELLLTREERRAKGKEKAGTKEAAGVRTSIPDQGPKGFMYGEFEPSLNHKTERRPTVQTFPEFFLDALKSPNETSSISPQAEPESTIDEVVGEGELKFEFEEDAIEAEAIRKVLADEIATLLGKTQALFEGLLDSPEMAMAVAEFVFGDANADADLQLRLAEAFIADDQVAGLSDLFEEVGVQVYELQLIVGALNPEYELQRSVALGLIDEITHKRISAGVKLEAERIGLQRRLQEILAGEGQEIDPMMAGIIEEGVNAAETERRRRAELRGKVIHGLRRKKNEERGQRFLDPDKKSGYDDLIQLLMSNRGDFGAIRRELPEELRGLLYDEERKGPIRREIAELTRLAQKRWANIQARLSAGTSQPEQAVARTRPAMRVLLASIEEIKELNVKLNELDVVEPAKPDYRSASRHEYVNRKAWERVPTAMTAAFQKSR